MAGGSEKRKKWIKCLLPAMFWLGVWTLCAAGVGKELLLPSPAAAFHALLELMGTEKFWRSVLMSLGRVTLGFLLGAGLGTLLGIVTAASGWCELLLSPALRAVRTVPVVSFILLLFFWLPTEQVPVAVSALMVLPVVWRSASQGIAAADPQLLELAGAYRLSLWRRVTHVYLPAALPALAAGWETALGLSWKSGVAAEVLCQPKWAAGTGLQTAKAYLDAPGLFAWTAVIVTMSLAAEGLLKLALRRWKGGGAA